MRLGIVKTVMGVPSMFVYIGLQTVMIVAFTGIKLKVYLSLGNMVMKYLCYWINVYIGNIPIAMGVSFYPRRRHKAEDTFRQIPL